MSHQHAGQEGHERPAEEAAVEHAAMGHGAADEHARPAAGHGVHAEHMGHAAHAASYRRRFWIALVLAIPVVLLSETVQDWFNYSIPDFPGDGAIPPVLGSIIYFYGGWPFLTGAVAEARRLQPGMMLLISLAITVAYIASVADLVGIFEHEFWWELSTLIVVMLFGHWQEMRALGQARGALAALAELLPDEAERVVGDRTESVPVTELREGDVVLIRPGARAPVDGVIVEGTADFDESVLTGETKPATRSVGDHVVAGAVAAGSSVRVRVSATGEDTTLAGIQRMIEAAQESKSRAQRLADRAAALLFYIAVGAAVVTFVAWVALGDSGEAVVRSVAVLVIACPHALGLAIPLVISISTSLSSKAGILVKDRLALERMRLVDVVLFDKTGTLTRGAHVVTGVVAVNSRGEGGVLRLAGAAERDSEHPLARAIVTAASRDGDLPSATEFRAIPGRGVEAKVEGQMVGVGGPGFLRERGLEEPDEIGGEVGNWRERGASVLYVVADGAVEGAIAVEDEVRPESRQAVAELQRLGIDVAMVTGDARQVAEAVGRELGITEIFAEVLPQEKDRAVAELQQRGKVVAMVGDGVNDAPALARADVGIAIGAGTDVAIESAGVVLVSDDPRAVVSVVRLSEASYRKMRQNLVWAAGYNVVAIPLAAGVLAGYGFVLPPAVGALLMSLSTVIVALNAQLLRGLRLRPE